MPGRNSSWRSSWPTEIKTVGVGPHRLGGRLIAAPPQDPPGSFTARFAGGYVSANEVTAAKSRRCAVPCTRVTTRAKRLAVFHLSLRQDFGTGLRLLVRNLTHFDIKTDWF